MAISADLGETLESVVTDLVKNGRYNSKSEVLREGVRLVQERETRLKQLDASIGLAISEADATGWLPADEVFARLEARYSSGNE